MRKSKVEKYLPISNKLWDLLLAFLEYHEGKRAPRSNWKIPEPTYRWRVINGGVVAETMGVCMIRSTRPREPGLYEVFGQAFDDLDKDEQAYILVLVSRQCELWLKGRAWEEVFKCWNLTRRQYAKLLRDALLRLEEMVERRGLRAA